MQAELWKKVEELYHAALAQPPEKRATFLAQACPENPAVRREVQLLLDKPADSFLETVPLSAVQGAGTRLGNFEIVQRDETQTIAESPSDTHQLQPGDVVGERFIIIQFLNRGGMGEVYEASDTELQGKHVALKTLRPEIASDPTMRERFEREVLVAREITHRNVCPTYNLFHMEGPRGPVSFLEMRLVRGESLAARLKRLGKLPQPTALHIARQLADGLDAAHFAGIIHRDFKPGNVMLEGLGEDIHAVITDFGLSRFYNSDSIFVAPGHISGTLPYMAPELLPPESRPASPASDVYAFGLVLHEMVTGERPPSGSKVRIPQLQQGLDRAVSGFLERDPAKRFQSAGEAMSFVGVGTPGRATSIRWPDLSRRTAIKVGAAAAAAGVWYVWPNIDAALHPLPERRFVALMAWPPNANPSMGSLLNGILDVIANRLVRAEVAFKQLLIIRPSDVAKQPVKVPQDVVSGLGANLVLAVSLRSQAKSLALLLTVMKAADGRVLREQRMSTPIAEAGHLPERASIAAAALLQVPLLPIDKEKPHDIAPVAFQAFAAAEESLRLPNDMGLEQAIAKYQEALEAEPDFARAYARLASAYARKYQTTRDNAVLRLAERNADRALAIAPASSVALLSRAVVDLYSGKTAEALNGMARAEARDPGNPDILMIEAAALDDLDLAAKAEGVYRRIIRQRPNYWPAYNDLGWELQSQGKIPEAAALFEEASAVAPLVALPLANAGSMYLLLGREDDAVQAFEKSARIAPNEFAYTNLGNVAFERRDYRKALDYHEKARDLSPKSDYCWRNIADCYDALGNRKLMVENYERASEVLARRLETNPNRGYEWMTLSLYHAKTGKREQAEGDMQTAEQRGASRVDARFVKAQTLAVLGRKEEALSLVLQCLDHGLSTVEVAYAMDLREIRADPRYRKRVAQIGSKPGRISP